MTRAEPWPIAFLDTNVLVYMYDHGASAKRAIARQLVRSGIERGTLVISVQVLGEFFSTVTKRIPNPLSTEEAETVPPAGTP